MTGKKKTASVHLAPEPLSFFLEAWKVQPSTLYFLNQPCIWFQPSSAASLR
jgi:hypothetical protein